MAVEFLDEPSVAQASTPAGSSGVSPGVEWMDEPKGVEFTNDASTPADASDVARRFLNPDYEPSLAEFKIYRQARKNRTFGQHVSDDLDLVGNAVAGLWDMVVAGGKALVTPQPKEPSGLQTVVEGVARGTVRDLELARQLLPDALAQTFGGGHLNFDQFSAVKLGLLNEQKFRYNPLTPENFHTRFKLEDVPPALLSEWRKEYDESLPREDYQNFLAKRQATREQLKLAKGETNLVPEIFGKAQPDVAEGLSLIAAPSTLVPFGKALTPAKTLTRAVAAKTLEGVGKTFEWVGEKTVQAGKLPERAAGAAARAITGSEDAAAKATEQVAAGIAGVSTLPVKAAGKTISKSGEAVEAIGRQAAEGPSRYGLFDRIAKDARSPEWLRRAANAARPLDKSISLAGSAAQGAVEGAAIGATLGGLAQGEEGAASGLGPGVMLGAGGGLAGRIVGGSRYRAQLEDMDIARWLSAKPSDQVDNIADLNLNRSQALALADVERLAKGASGDVEFRYLSDKAFTDLFGVGKGAQTLQGDRPVVFVNTGYRGPRSAFHEVMHALDALEGFTPQKQALNRVLFDQTLPDGTTVSRGIYSAADLAEFTSQYRARLNQSARSEFDLLTPEDRQQRILAEVRAESFANLLSGRAGFHPGRGLRSRVADKLLLSEHASMLGRMRRALESAGVKFNASGEPSELFVRHGRPITNTPAVDAALRDYLRAKDQITRRLNAGEDEAPEFVVRPQDLQSKGNQGLIDVFKDNDIFAKNPDGTVKMLGGVPVLLSEREINLVQRNRVDAMLQALDAVPDTGAAGMVRKKDNGAYEGTVFSDAQLAALARLPDDVLPPAMKSKLQALNELAKLGDGSQIILDYNAALKSRRYSSGIAPTTRASVPLTFNISKAGNFYMTTLDTSHFFRKLGEWRRSKPRAFDAWGGDTDAFLRDVFAYLDNHRNGRRGSVNLDADPATAETKKNVINNFFNVPQGEGVNPVQISGKGERENLIRSRRFDRINRITPGAGDKFPVKYELLKANFLPAAQRPASSSKQQGELTGPLVGETRSGPPLSPRALHNHQRAQAVFDLARITPGPRNLAQLVAEAYVDGLAKHGKLSSVGAITPQQMAEAMAVLTREGWDGLRRFSQGQSTAATP